MKPAQDMPSKSQALCLYSGSLIHARIKPVLHRFNYTMSCILIDLDRLEMADKASRIFSVNKGNLISFHEKDFGPRDGSSLRLHVDSLMNKAGLVPAKTIQLMCYPRVLGYGFNPLSVYYCMDADNNPTCLIYEVRNTFNEMHTYIEPVQPDQINQAGIRQSTRKQFYVSPFLDMDMTYHFRVSLPDKKLALRILENDPEGPILAAGFIGTRKPANNRFLAKTVLQTMGLTWKVTAGIHFEALFLWLKGLKIRPRLAHKLSYSLPNGKQKGGRAHKKAA